MQNQIYKINERKGNIEFGLHSTEMHLCSHGDGWGGRERDRKNIVTLFKHVHTLF
jgi:hypothetical protein